MTFLVMQFEIVLACRAIPGWLVVTSRVPAVPSCRPMDLILMPLQVFSLSKFCIAVWHVTFTWPRMGLEMLTIEPVSTTD